MPENRSQGIIHLQQPSQAYHLESRPWWTLGLIHLPRDHSPKRSLGGETRTRRGSVSMAGKHLHGARPFPGVIEELLAARGWLQTTHCSLNSCSELRGRACYCPILYMGKLRQEGLNLLIEIPQRVGGGRAGTWSLEILQKKSGNPSHSEGPDGGAG